MASLSGCLQTGPGFWFLFLFFALAPNCWNSLLDNMLREVGGWKTGNIFSVYWPTLPAKLPWEIWLPTKGGCHIAWHINIASGWKHNAIPLTSSKYLGFHLDITSAYHMPFPPSTVLPPVHTQGQVEVPNAHPPAQRQQMVSQTSVHALK